MADASLRTQVEASLLRLDELIKQGREIRELLAKDRASGATLAAAANRAWQNDCGLTIHELSGGSKAHWLARAFSEAFLVRAADGRAVEGAAAEELVERLIGVLEKAVTSLSKMDPAQMLGASSQPAPRRFDFVHNAELRPVVEQAYNDGREALHHGDYEMAMKTSCGVLEAIVTDALEHKGTAVLLGSGVAGRISDWSFETRLAIAEQAGLIRGGWARLPAAARAYREHEASGPREAITERDAKISGQVLHVVMRDLNPGR